MKQSVHLLKIKNVSTVIKWPTWNKKKTRLDRERNITIAVIILIIAFFVSWTPYAIVSLYAGFFEENIPPLLTTLPAMFAKTSLLWTSMFYLFTNKQFKSKIGKLFGFKRGETSYVLSKILLKSDF
jgi:hypothetical protein